ncbi:hypothetical protein [Psychroserpens luteus]|uniref:WG containing repeat-containing protein n=1 Tax=Psychroserpens luteus TaxID=1434066 RepID=A0ABW5ZZQ5_9FLAO|nr:hypothetical protein [Psychroserpens luteus]
MKTILTILFVIFNVININAQTDLEIGSVHLDRAEQSYLDNNMREARKHFDKAILYIKEITDSRVARLGTLLSYDIKDYTKAKILAKRYFELEKDNTKDSYKEMLVLYVTIDDDIKLREIEEERLRLERIKLENEKRHLDSITNLWTQKSSAFLLDIDDVKAFNKYNLAIYRKAGKLGLIDDRGTIIIEANTYEYAIDHDGYILFTDDEMKPTRVFCYNISTKEGYQLPSVTQFDNQAYDYGKFMLPRTNGLLVTYPTNTANVLVFDLNTKQFQSIEDKKEMLKTLKKNDIIDKYNKELQIKIEKDWFELGNTVGGGIHAIYNEKNELHGFLSTSEGKIYSSNYYSHLGAFCDGKFQIIENGTSGWMDAEGLKFDSKPNESGNYSGNSKYVKVKAGQFKILEKNNDSEMLILEDEKLLLLQDFIEKHSVKN